MADPNNPGQFGNREDTEKQAKAGGDASTGKFGSENGADPHKAGKKGGENAPERTNIEDKNSHSDKND